MFDRSTLQSLVDESATLPHVVSVLAPYAFELRPVGFQANEPNYRVLVERTAFQLKATVSPDYLAVAIVAAVVAGAGNNPSRVERLQRECATSGWGATIDLTPKGFRLEASCAESPGMDDDERSAAAIVGALLLSEFIIDQLVITRSFGELRPAVERAISSEPSGDLWLYDPSERDRSTQVHRSLENWLMTSLREAGCDPLDPAGEPFFDVAWSVGGQLFVCEVKSTMKSEVHQIRLGIGQVLQYRELLESAGWSYVIPVLLVERRPIADEWARICDRLGIRLLWPTNWPAMREQLTGGPA